MFERCPIDLQSTIMEVSAMQKHVTIGHTPLVRYKRVGGGFCYELNGRNVTSLVSETIRKMQAGKNPGQWDEALCHMFDLEFRALL